MLRIHAALRRTALVLAATLLPLWAQAASYLVTVDTSSFEATLGFIDFQFNPLAGAPTATATVSAFDGSFVLDGAPTVDGSVSGALPGTVTLTNTSGLNALLQPGTFGTGFGFRLDLDDAGVAGPLSVFALGVYGEDFVPLLPAELSGLSLTLTLEAGTVTLVNEAPGFIAVTSVEPIPEPSTYALMLAGLVLLGATARRSTRR